MRIKVITLVYHFFNSNLQLNSQISTTEKPYYLSISHFKDHLIFLDKLKFVFNSISSFLINLKGSNKKIENFLILTFDDGHISNYHLAWPQLKKFNFTATFFIVPTWVGKNQCMSWKQIRELANSGMEIGSHTLTHPFLIKLTRKQIIREFSDSKKIIEDHIQQPCNYLAIPYGFTRPEYEEIAKECGYKGICDSKVSFRSDLNSTFSRIHRIGVRSDCDVNWLKSIVEGDFVLRTKMILYDRFKSLLKRSMGLEKWLLFRENILRRKYQVKHADYSC